MFRQTTCSVVAGWKPALRHATLPRLSWPTHLPTYRPASHTYSHLQIHRPLPCHPLPWPTQRVGVLSGWVGGLTPWGGDGVGWEWMGWDDARQNMTTHRWTIGLGFPLAPAGCDHCGWPTPKLSGCQPHDSPPQPPHGGGGGARSARQQAHWKVFNFSGAGLVSGV